MCRNRVSPVLWRRRAECLGRKRVAAPEALHRPRTSCQHQQAHCHLASLGGRGGTIDVLSSLAARCDAMTVDELRREALRLDHAARAKLAHDLLDSLDDLSEGEIEQLWLQEAVRRHDAIVAGEVQTIPGDEVLAQARAARGGPDRYGLTPPRSASSTRRPSSTTQKTSGLAVRSLTPQSAPSSRSRLFQSRRRSPSPLFAPRSSRRSRSRSSTG